jgi:tungstate transport system ATP-binding protein
MASSDALFRLESIEHRYGPRVVLDIEHLEVMRGETLAIIGPSGCGKTTLLRLLQFLERPSAGRLLFDGQQIDTAPQWALRRRVTTVFQRPIVLNRSVRDNLAYGLVARGVKAYGDRIVRLLDALALAPFAHAPARTLSGGEVQRVAFGRALAFDPEVLLLDEPTANLDPRNVALIEQLIRDQKARGATIVLATHHVFQARRLADRTAFLLDGRVVEIAPTSRLFDTPTDPRTRAFLTGDMVY